MATPDERAKAGAKIIAKAWHDDAFKKHLIANPHAALKENGVDVPAGVTVKVHEDSEHTHHIVLPAKPKHAMTEDDLRKSHIAPNFTCFI